MEQVFPIDATQVSSGPNISRMGVFSPLTKEGVIEKVLRPGLFLVSIGDGVKLKVSGPSSLREGNRVQVLVPIQVPKRPRTESLSNLKSSFESEGIYWNIFMPLGFGGKAAEAKLEVFVEKQSKKSLEKKSPAVYLIFTVKTEKQGEIQWSVYLKQRQVSLQVYAGMRNNFDDGLKFLIQMIEKSIKLRGFVLMTPTLVLKRPFKVPAGFRLNVSG